MALRLDSVKVPHQALTKSWQPSEEVNKERNKSVNNFSKVPQGWGCGEGGEGHDIDQNYFKYEYQNLDARDKGLT